MKKWTMSLKKGMPFALLLAALFLWMVCVEAQAVETVTVDVSGTYGQDEARSMLEMVNDFRTGRYVDGGQSQPWARSSSEEIDIESYTGLSELQYDYDLEATAMQRAMEIAVTFNCYHERPNTESCFTAFPSGYTSRGENIAAGTGYYGAEKAFDTWCETDDSYSGQGHRRNMLSSNYNRVGIGHVVVTNGMYTVHFWVQDFGYKTGSEGLVKTPAENGQKTVPVEVWTNGITDSRINVGSDSISMQVFDTRALPEVRYEFRMTDTWPGEFYIPADSACVIASRNSSIASLSGNIVTGVKAGTTSLIVRTELNPAMSEEISVTVNPRVITNNGITLTGGESFDYTGKPIRPRPVVNVDNRPLEEGKDYTVEYKDNTNAGTATVTVTGQGNYANSVPKEFKILPLSLATARVDLAGWSSTYNGKAQKPVPVVNLDGRLLELDKDYNLSYSNNVNAGTATVTVNGIGNYKSSRPTGFTIWPQNLEIADVKVGDQVYTGSKVTPDPVITLDGLTLKKDTDYTVVYENNTAIGTATVKITGKAEGTGKGNYKGKVTKTFKITAIPLAGAKVKASKQTYTGKALKPAPTVTLDGVTLKKDTDYTVVYKNNTKVGNAGITVTGKGVYAGTASGTFKIASPYDSKAAAPGTPIRFSTLEKALKAYKSEKDHKNSTFSILQAKGVTKSGSSVKLTWKKVSGATKYVIYGTKCGSYKFKKVVALKSSKTGYEVKKLKKGTYYKYVVVAVKDQDAIALSRTIHVATGGGKAGNPSSVKLSKSSLSLSVGASGKVSASVKKSSKKISSHRTLTWESGNINIAKVSSAGKITGVAKGSCYVYAYAQNGAMAKVKVTVK